MWMAELAARSGVPVPTIKYYLREGLLPPGELTGATRATYDEQHVQRLRLIRALVEVAGMRLEQVRGVLAVIDDEETSLHDAIGAAHSALSPAPPTPPSAESRVRVAELARARRWRVDPDGAHATALAAALDAMAAAGQPLSDRTLAGYGDAMAAVARTDLAGIDARDRSGAAAYAVIGTLLVEPVLVSLRRLAQENLSRRRHSRRGG